MHLDHNHQPWIWAAGPVQFNSDGSATPVQHTSHGVIFANMNKAQTSNAGDALPEILSETNISVKPQPFSYKSLVIVHAICLGFAFVLIFPLGVIGLRWPWKRFFVFHLVAQVTGTVAIVCGLVFAISLSVVGIAYNGFQEPHQRLGLVVIILVFFQAAAGHRHHVVYLKEKSRSVVSYIHMFLGRGVVYMGMGNAAL
jgi:hypothetical protein